jgi:hypothetical protein
MTRELKEICRREAPTLVKELIRLATSAESEAVRVAAIKEMFDRGFGRATQPIEGTMTYGVSEQLAELFKENASATLGSEVARRALRRRMVSTSRNCTSRRVWSLGSENEQQCQPPR